MDIEIFQIFLKSQRDGFTTFLKGCSDLTPEAMRSALVDHTTEMTFALTTSYPIFGRRSISTPFEPATGIRSAKRATSSTLKTPNGSFLSQSPPGSNLPFKSPGPVPDVTELAFVRRPSIFQRSASNTSVTPFNTPNSKSTTDPRSSSKAHSHARTPSRSAFRGGMTIGGAGLLFKNVTPKGKGHATAHSTDSSAGSPLTSGRYPKRSSSAKKGKKSTMTSTPTSPFEVAARKAERKHNFCESDSTSDFEIALPKSTVRKVSSARKQREGAGEMNATGSDMDAEYETDDIWEDKIETPSKKQKLTIQID